MIIITLAVAHLMPPASHHNSNDRISEHGPERPGFCGVGHHDGADSAQEAQDHA
jgi:hypothetical protein